MAKSNRSPAKPAPKPAPAKAVASTPVRNSAVPPKAAAATAPAVAPKAVEVTHEMIARRAYEIATSGMGGSEFDNWIRAERELRGQAGA